MSNTEENPIPPDGPAFNRDRLNDLDQLRRSHTDRYLGGVAGGLGQHFRIDPIVVRVILAASCVFGGIGFLIYGLLWLFVPAEDTDRAKIDLNGSTRRSVLLIFGGIAALGIIGSVFGGLDGFSGHFAWPLAIIVGTCAVALAYLRPAAYREHGPRIVATDDTRPAPSSRSRRVGPILFWPTLATIFVAFGILGIVAVDHTVAPLWWPGSALAIIGLALVVGAFRGRPGGLIPLGILLIPGVLVTTVLGSGGWDTHNLDVKPGSAAAVNASYTIGTGHAVLDLTDVTDVPALAGRTITVEMTAGKLEVKLPADLVAQVDANLAIAGDIQINGAERNGWEPSFHAETGASSKAPPVHLILKGRVGVIQVETQGAAR